VTLKLGRLDVAIQGTRIVMAGRIDDSVVLADLPAQLPAGDLVIDTGAVTFINSIGMREWIRLMRALAARGQPVVLERVADVMMTQINLIGELRTTVRIASFHAQYACPACGAESAPLIDAIAHADELRAMRAPHLPCRECGAQMDLADFPERYLSIFSA
jgi:anti-anti-sigma regulatory factor